jgi:hypothetical protein
MARHTRQPALCLPSPDEHRACLTAGADERRAVWITVLMMYAAGQLSRAERDGYAVALHYEVYTRRGHEA